MREEQILINKLKINYKIAGEGPAILNSEEIKVLPSQGRGTVLILHGWGGSSISWTKVQDILAAAGFRVIVLDFPGFGKSVTPPKAWDVRDYTDFVLNFMKELKLEDFFLVAHSFGGRVAVKLAISHPEKIKKLVLCDSAGIKPRPGLKTRMIYLAARIGNAVFTPKHLQRFKDGARNFFYIFLRHRDYVKADGTMRETIKKVLDEDLLEDLAKIKTETLLIWGEKDKLVPLRYGFLFKERIQGSRLEILPGVGHSPHLEAPKKLAGIILKFLL